MGFDLGMEPRRFAKFPSGAGGRSRARSPCPRVFCLGVRLRRARLRRLSRTTAPEVGLAPGHLSATVPESLLAGPETSLWSEAAELYRRICLLRSRGLSIEAARLQSTELSRAVGALREASGDGSACEARLNTLFAREEERVANASVLAELLVPMLRDTVVTAAAPRTPSGALPRRAPPMRAASPSTPTAAPGIADFIDEMIQQERAEPTASAP